MLVNVPISLDTGSADTGSLDTGSPEEMPPVTKPHVLLLVENYSVPHDRRVWNEARTLREAGYAVSVISPKGEKLDTESFERVSDVDIYRFPMPFGGKNKVDFLLEYGWAMSASLALALRVWRKNPFVAMHVANPPDFYFPFERAFRSKGVKFIFDQHDLSSETYLEKFDEDGSDTPTDGEASGGLVYKALQYCEKKSFQAASMVISTNQSYRERAINECGIEPDRVMVVRNAPDPHVYQQRPARPELRGEYDSMVMFVGVMGFQDGVHVLLDAAHHVREARGRTDILFALVGTGDQKQDLLAQHERLGLGEGVRFTGFISEDDMLDYLATADLGVAPDLNGPLNDVSTMTKIMDYMSMGMPVVSFDLKEARYTAGDAAAYVKENSGEALGEMIIELIDDPERRATMGAAGYERVTGPLSWEKSSENLLEVYNRALAT